MSTRERFREPNVSQRGVCPPLKCTILPQPDHNTALISWMGLGLFYLFFSTILLYWLNILISYLNSNFLHFFQRKLNLHFESVTSSYSGSRALIAVSEWREIMSFKKIGFYTREDLTVGATCCRTLIFHKVDFGCSVNVIRGSTPELHKSPTPLSKPVFT